MFPTRATNWLISFYWIWFWRWLPIMLYRSIWTSASLRRFWSFLAAFLFYSQKDPSTGFSRTPPLLGKQYSLLHETLLHNYRVHQLARGLSVHSSNTNLYVLSSFMATTLGANLDNLVKFYSYSSTDIAPCFKFMHSTYLLYLVLVKKYFS